MMSYMNSAMDGDCAACLSIEIVVTQCDPRRCQEKRNHSALKLCSFVSGHYGPENHANCPLSTSMLPLLLVLPMVVLMVVVLDISVNKTLTPGKGAHCDQASCPMASAVGCLTAGLQTYSQLLTKLVLCGGYHHPKCMCGGLV